MLSSISSHILPRSAIGVDVRRLHNTDIQEKIVSCKSCLNLKTIIETEEGLQELAPNQKNYLNEVFDLYDRRSISLPLEESALLSALKICLLTHETSNFSDVISFAIYICSNFSSNQYRLIFDPNHFLKPENTIELFLKNCDLISKMRHYPEIIDESLKSFLYRTSFYLLNKILEKEAFCCFGNLKERSLDDVVEDFKSTNPNLYFALPLDKIKTVAIQYNKICQYEEEINRNKSRLPRIIGDMKKKNFGKVLSENDKLFLLAAARIKYREKFGPYAYSSQLMTILAMTLPLEMNLKGRIAQVKTGEGKSLINCLLALLFAMEGKCVDVITSSDYLAVRDQIKFREFYSYFGIKSSHICKNNPSKSDFKGQIIYGVNHNFIWANLREKTSFINVKMHFQNSKVQRPSEVVLVDEVDNILIDKASNSGLLGIKAKVKLGGLFRCIFHIISNIEEENILKLKQIVSNEAFIGYFREFSLQYEGGSCEEVMRTISDTQLKIYFNSAISAIYEHKIEEHYVINHQKERNQFGIITTNKMITIVQKDTGRLSHNCRWPNGLHEFLELKHNVPIKSGILSLAHMSHPVFFNLYEQIYGLTGTIGTKVERKEMFETFALDSFQVPTYNPPQRIKEKTLVCSSEVEFFQSILDSINRMQNMGRPILILCETVFESKKIHQFLLNQDLLHEPSLINEVQVENEELLINEAGMPARTTVATNTASRGTDIILKTMCLTAGGLHVLLTYFPSSIRVEEQCEGRAGRQGQPGSCQIIIPPYDECLKGLDPKAPNVLETILQRRNASIVKESRQRSERAEIEKISDYFLNQFFDALKIFHDEISDEYFKSEVFEKINIQILKELKEKIIYKFSASWAILYSKFSEILDDTRQFQNLNVDQSISFAEQYRVNLSNLFNQLKEEYRDFWEDPKKCFLSGLSGLSGFCDKLSLK